MKELIGVIGCGNMGGRLVKRFISFDHTVYFYDINPKTVEEMKKAGAIHCASIEELVKNSQFVVTSLPDGKVLEAALFDQGLLDMLKTDKVLVDTSTTLPRTMDRVSEYIKDKGTQVLDCPISGGPNEITNGNIVSIVAGKKELFDRCKFITDMLGKEQHYMGEKLGAAKAAKLVNNSMSLCNAAAGAEAFTMGVKFGADPVGLYNMLMVGGGRSNQFTKRFRYVLDKDYTARGSTAIGEKDVALAVEFGESVGCEMKIAKLARSYYQKAIEAGYANEDFASVFKIFDPDWEKHIK